MGKQFGEGKNIREERQIITGREEEEEEHKRKGKKTVRKEKLGLIERIRLGIVGNGT